MTGYDLVAIVNLLEDHNKKDYGFALYKEEYELLRTANLNNTLVVVNARNKDRRVLGKVKVILPVSVYGENPTAQVVGVVNMNAYMKRKKEEKKRIDKINELKSLIKKNEIELTALVMELRMLEG
ncbi:hypothetical protein F290043J8_18730 [Mediterraneibacter gnavus]|jgi:peroxiredoxin family protein|uniref:hypothetical protein n=1 Tax=Mediterraneibacter gnavus TaxID=33038 RepID=UPI000E524359|nr:hypothetical protein [Mediterraneibacter gnavus]RHE72409.1 hypothetical protein DW722_07110 [Mediterraneibacter gnavus]RHM40450.1 hypothetical protein DWZ70_02955 [Mediterraneibacter gnavus]DAJ49878.1 MAG TPA: hypothetical protein [Caudoviricetes sp.]DAV75009.1 MAG TPA: hypothetical protein [Caudoviricetes sp.]